MSPEEELEKIKISRDLFIQVVKETFNKEQYEKLLDFIEECRNKDGWILQYHNETVLIYDTATDRYISWYKIVHLGRSLNTNINTVYDLRSFLKQIMYDVFDVPEPEDESENESEDNMEN